MKRVAFHPCTRMYKPINRAVNNPAGRGLWHPINWDFLHKLANYIVGNGQRAVPKKCGNYTERHIVYSMVG